MALGKKQKGASSESYAPLPDNSMDRYSRNSGVYAQKKAAILAEYSRENSTNYSHKRAKKGSRGKKVAIAICSILVLALVGAGTAFALFVQSVSESMSGNYTEQEKMDIQEALVSKSFNEPFYVLLIGGDGREDVSGSRTDTNILCRVDPTNKVVTMLSIPRDTMITYDGSTMKFNAAYVYGGLAGTISATKTLCGVDISHYVIIDFPGLIGLVDAVGGVTVEVPELIDDPDAGSVVIQPGLQTLNGEAALVFARSRAYADGDFTRTSNQRLLVQAMVNKVLAMSVTEIPGVVQQAAKCVETDLSVFDIYSLALQFREGMTIYSAMVPSTTDYIDGVSYVICDTETLASMMKIIEAGGDPNTVDNYNGSVIGSALYN